MISPEILRRYPYFAAADDKELRDLAMLCEEESIPSGTVMYQEGDRADKLYIRVEGEVEDHQHQQGEEEHGAHRLAGAPLQAQVLGEDGEELVEEGHFSSRDDNIRERRRGAAVVTTG